MDTTSIPSPATVVAAASASAATEPTKSPDDNVNTSDDDRQQQDGTALSTFSQYQPSALPLHIMERHYRKQNNSDSSLSLQQEQSSRTSAIIIPSHTSPACESNLLSSVPAPRLHNIDALAANFLPMLQQHPPALSPLQLEGVLLALQRHKRIFRNGERAGFFIGDGAGIGKGRQIAAILRDSLCRKSPDNTTGNNDKNSQPGGDCTRGHTKRHLWISVSRELIQDARRDLKDLGVHCDVHDGTVVLDEYKNGGLGQKDKGIMFLTYPLLVSGKRVEQIIEWCAGTHLLRAAKAATSLTKKRQLEQAYQGVIVFDEAHRCKNIANNTKTAKLGLELQRRLPKARIVYCSATGVSDVAHLAYAERLGLWDHAPSDGAGSDSSSNSNGSTHHFANFSMFCNSLTSKGLASLEMLALELKQQGSFLARSLSWDGAEFETLTFDLSDSQRRVYDDSVKWWNSCRAQLESALKIVGSEKSASLLWRIFWSSHQRFFKELAVCAKVESIAEDALKQVHENGCCVVVGLQSTGEAGMQSLVEASNDRNGCSFQDKQFPALVSTLEATLTTFVNNHFPTSPTLPEPPKLPNQPPSPTSSAAELERYDKIRAEIARIKTLPAPEPIPDLLDTRQNLVDAIKNLNLPPNPLDDLIERLGGIEHVAEMTGRSGRIVRAHSSSNPAQKQNFFVFSKRFTTSSNSSPSQDDSDRLNLMEKRAFQDGKKAFAIISDAASTGISLHAARGSGGSHRRRVHYTIELPWSADRAVQQLGRSHRSGQESAPLYKLVVTSLGGERRFAAAVSRRMTSLGALSKGDRRAATGGDMFSDFDLDSKYGTRALKRLYSALESNMDFYTDSSGAMPASMVPSRKTKEVMAEFVKQLTLENDPLVSNLLDDVAACYSLLLSVATRELDVVGLDYNSRKKPDVRVFLNRLAGIPVTRQNYIFSLFVATLDDVITSAKGTGEFEGTAEDIKATTIEICKEIPLAKDPASGAQTKLEILTLDRGVSLESVCAMAVAEARKHVAKQEGDVTDSSEELTSPEEEDDKLSSTGDEEDTVASQGFYLSRNKVAGRHYILFAKHKYQRSAFENIAAAMEFDPLGLMLVERPNTGFGGEMSTQELNRKYKLLLKCDSIKLCEGKTTTDAEILERACPQVTDLWQDAFQHSNYFTHQNGLAPRRQEVALITGPSLHILAELEKAVVHRSEKDRALKIMRAQVGGRRIVGVRFPSDEKVIQQLQAELYKLSNNRKNTEEAFVDEELSPVCGKSKQWATSERKTIKSFFAVKSSPEKSGNKGPVAAPFSQPTNRKRAGPATTKTQSSNKKSKSITSFFKTAGKN